jgi:hypothetical protein
MRAISLVPDFGRVAVGGLSTFDNRVFRRSTRNALLNSGVRRFILGLDISLNHEDGKLEDAYFQLQWWGIFDEPGVAWREQLKAFANRTGIVSRPIKVITPKSREATAAYGLKNTFTRRVSYVESNLNRLDRGEARNTRDRFLRGAPSMELMLFLDRLGLENRLLWHGIVTPFQHLRTRAALTRLIAG